MKFLVLDTFSDDSLNDSDDLAAFVLRVDMPIMSLATFALELFRQHHKRGLSSTELSIDDVEYGIWAYRQAQGVRAVFGPLASLSGVCQFPPCVATDIEPTSCVIDNELRTPIIMSDTSIRFWFNRWSLVDHAYSDADLRMSITASVMRVHLADEPDDNDNGDLVLLESVFVSVAELVKLPI